MYCLCCIYIDLRIPFINSEKYFNGKILIVNKEDNLEVLCPNCHSLTETYGSLNKNGRKERRIKKDN